jgi:hypothetical protein
MVIPRRGTRGRWYREARAYPEAVLHVGERQLPVHLEPVRDAATIARVSDAIMRKYVQGPKDAHAMVRDEVLATTLRLHPAETSKRTPFRCRARAWTHHLRGA